jgi:hypothetical protein
MAAFAAVVVLLLPGQAPALTNYSGSSASTCRSSGPADGSYTVDVCLTAPADGSTVSGDAPVTATVTATSGTNPGIRKLVYYLDGAYLLTDYEAPYTFKLPSAKFVDGPRTLSVEADMRPTIGGFVTPQTSISLTFQNGVTTPPTNTNTFNVRTGSNPAPGAPLVVAAAGDGAGGEQSESDTTNLIASWNPNLFLYLGDVYEQGTSTEFHNWYRQQANPGTTGGSTRSPTRPSATTSTAA